MRLPSKYNRCHWVAGRSCNGLKNIWFGKDCGLILLVRTFLLRRVCQSLCWVVAGLMPQVHASEVLLEQAWQDLQQLSSDEMAGRFPGSAGHQRAQQHIINRFNELKLLPLLADYRQPFQFQF